MARRRSSISDAPLLAWGEALRRSRARRERLARGGAAIAVGLVLVGATVIAPPAPRLVWNSSASAPIGLYAVSPGAAIGPGDMVIARVPERFRMLAATRHYIPANVPLVKRAAAQAGDIVCARETRILVDERRVAVRRSVDGSGRPMPWWRGCIRLGRGQYLLLIDAPDSFDGRYFGITDGVDIIGKARPLWTG